MKARVLAIHVYQYGAPASSRRGVAYASSIFTKKIAKVNYKMIPHQS